MIIAFTWLDLNLDCQFIRHLFENSGVHNCIRKRLTVDSNNKHIERKSLSKFSLFRKPGKKEKQEERDPKKHKLAEPVGSVESTGSETSVSDLTSEKPSHEVKAFLRAMPLRSLSDLDEVKNEIKKGNIIILRITPLASKSIDEVKQAVDQLTVFTESIQGDIARLGEERIVVCPERIKIWREKTPTQTMPTEALPTAA